MGLERAVLLAVLVGTGCGAGSSTPDAAPLPPTDRLDMLFVIDDSGTTGELQGALINGFSAFTAQLAARFGGELPDLHIGVTTGNLGAGGFDYPGCDSAGGRLLVRQSEACEAPTEPWIHDYADGAGGRVRNVAAELDDAFRCLALRGVGGCGFQQHLGAVRAALDGRYREHDGFVRDGAILAVVIVADDDDCTAADPAVYDDDPDAGVGPVSTFRCARYGWLCDGEPIPDEDATYLDCEPRRDSYLVDPDDTVAFLDRLKPDPRMVMTAAVVADRSPVKITVTDTGARHDNICGELPHSTNIRDRAVVDATGGLWIDSCDADLGPGLSALADRLATRMGAP